MLMNYSRFALKPVLRVATPPQLGSPAMVWQRSRLWLSSARRQRRLVSSGVVRRRRSFSVHGRQYPSRTRAAGRWSPLLGSGMEWEPRGVDLDGTDSERDYGFQTWLLHVRVSCERRDCE